MSSWRRPTGLSKLEEARSTTSSGRLAHDAGDPTAETYFRQAVELYWSAMNWLEDDDGFDVAHDEIHEVGRLLRGSFEAGCSLGPREDGSFAHTCPVFLSHKRFGMSPGFTGDAVCSICYQDASECVHVPGDIYEVVARSDPWCNVCGERACASHALGATYKAEAGMVVTKAALHEVSIVDRPAQPDARIREILINDADIEASLGPLPAGAFLKCDKCLGPCTGFDRVEEQ